MDRITTYEQAIEFLYGRINYERVQVGSYATSDFKLDRMRCLLDRLGNPQETIPAVHIAGTKGKGTTSAMLARILEVAGYRVGLYTSPHITSFEERMKVNGQMPSREDIVQLVQQVAEECRDMDRLPGQMSPTFFELTMALAWLWFRRQQIDLVVLEVGLGGRLDATNICRPVTCAITSISRDHTGLLGSTLAEIAREKAGIVKPGIPVVCGVQDATALATIEQICANQQAPLYVLDRNIFIWVSCNENIPGRTVFGLQTFRTEYRNLTIPLVGDHQFRNAAVAVSLIDSLSQQGWKISEAAVREGLASTRWPLRIEVVRTEPTVVLDVAHNWASISALLETLNRNFVSNRRTLIFAASRDKDVTGMLRQLIPQFDTVIVTKFAGNPRGVALGKLTSLVHALSGRFAHAANTPSQAWQLARHLANPEDLVCGTGSFFLAAELQEVLNDDNTSTAVRYQKEQAANLTIDGLLITKPS